MDSSSNQTQTPEEKCWLIRTTQRQLLGPVTKEKILSFLEKGALCADDEIASGNGYWFSVKEKDLVEKYLLGDIPQSFNPISEAPSVLTASLDQKEGTASLYPNPAPGLNARKEESNFESNADSASSEQVHLPAQDDLEYPDLDNLMSSPPQDIEQSEDITTVLKLDSLTKGLDGADKRKSDPPSSQARELLVSEIDEDAQLPDQADLEYPDLGSESFDGPPSLNDIEPPKIQTNVKSEDSYNEAELGSKKKASKRKKKVIEAPQRNDRYLFYLLALLILLTASVFYYYKKVLNKPFPIIGEFVSFVVPVAQAQVLAPDNMALKKKDFLT